jgi:hypothetical protein
MMTPLTIVVLLASITMAHAEPSRRFYNEKGQIVGTATTNNNGVTTFRDSKGVVTGTSVHHGGTTTFFNANGQRTGTAARR